MIIVLFALMAVVSAQKQLNLHPADSTTTIWSDKDSWVDKDLKISRSVARPGYYRVGDVVDNSFKGIAKGYLVRPTNQDMFDQLLVEPESYCTVWNSRGSSAKKYGQLWEPQCPQHFVALGYVATNGTSPEPGDIYCVNDTYAVQGKLPDLQDVWTCPEDKANVGVELFRLQRESDDVLSTGGFYAKVKNNTPKIPCFLKSEMVNVLVDPPVKALAFEILSYDKSLENDKGKLTKISGAALENYQSEFSQTHNFNVTFNFNESVSFILPECIKIDGVKVSLNAKIPVYYKKNKQMDVNVTDYTCSQNILVKHDVGLSTKDIAIPPRYPVDVWFEGDKTNIKRKIGGKVTKFFFNGASKTTNFTFTDGASYKTYTFPPFRYVVSRETDPSLSGNASAAKKVFYI